ncbi:MAG: plasmid replication protein RepC [Pseudomonadota bacterium]
MNGGRIGTPKFREASRQSEEFKGLPQGVTRFDLLKLVKHAGREIGFTDRMIQLLEYYLLFTKDQDWKEGARPVMYQSQYKTALHFGVSERQIQKIEGSLFNVGALTWNDSGNYRRFGVRAEDTGEILYAYGVDLSPLAFLYPVLQKKLHEKELHDTTWMEQKRRISWYRARIRTTLAEYAVHDALQAQIRAASDQYDAIAVPIRAYMPLETLLDLCRQHESLYEQVLDTLEGASPVEDTCGLSQESSSMDVQKGVHTQTTNKNLSDKSDSCSPQDTGFRGSVVRPSVITGTAGAGGKAVKPEIPEVSEKLANISWKQVLNAASPRFQEQLHRSYGNRPRALNWSDIIDAAYAVRIELGISKAAWADACQTLGQGGAAICVMVIDQKALDPADPIRNPGGYLRGMVKKAREGKLNLHGSVFGLLKRGEGELNA